MTGDARAIARVTLSRTVIPALPPGYLSRKHLFSLIDCQTPGTTFVLAPAGYGKTSLVAEWAAAHRDKVIWLTLAEGDSLNEMSAMLIIATRNLIPGFAPWFENEQPIRPTDLVRRWGNELLQAEQDYILVLDNLRQENESDVDIANQLIAQFPNNLHFVSIRKDSIDSIYATCASRGPLKYLPINNLRFSDDEIDLLVNSQGVSLSSRNSEILRSANGWPSAISLLLENMKTSVTEIDLEKVMGIHDEPLRALANYVVNELENELVEMLEKLSIVESFSLEIAQLLLGDKYSYELINGIALRGEILTLSPHFEQDYLFSPLMREVFAERLRRKPAEEVALHKLLIKYFESRGESGRAIDHAFRAGEVEKIHELFPRAARIKQAQGRGGELLRWAPMAALDTDEGDLKALTVTAVGHLANLDFKSALADSEKLVLTSANSPAREFYYQLATGVNAYISLSRGNFHTFLESTERVLEATQGCMLGVDDQINLLRSLAAYYYILDDCDKVEEIFLRAQDLAKTTLLTTSHTFLLCIQAMSLHQLGEYRQAFEVAQIAIRQSQKNGFVGLHGPLDAIYIAGRCNLEFSRHKEAFELFEQLNNLSYQWKQWHWYFAAEDKFLQDLMLRGHQHEALERLKKSRELAASFEFNHQLSSIIDINEMYIRRALKDFDRLETLVNRAPRARQTEQFKFFVDEYRGRKSIISDAQNLPNKTPREQIWKALMEVTRNINSEQIALPAMRQAMKVGASVGAKETFLRQNDEMGNLIIRIASESPTVYNEELASAMADRIRERRSVSTEAREGLTKRELEILRQLSTGRTLTVIASELHISQNTMKTHLKNLYRKMAVASRSEAVEKARSLYLL